MRPQGFNFIARKPVTQRHAKPLAHFFVCAVFAALPSLAIPAFAQQGAVGISERTISVSGKAERRVQPDMALISVEVFERAADVNEARAKTDKVTADALDALRALGVEDGDIDTTGLRVNPQYRWAERDREQQLSGYEVARSIEVRLLNLEDLGALLVKLAELGVNRVDSPVLKVKEEELLYQQVLADAAQNARDRADALADALGASVGDVLTLQANSRVIPRPMSQVRERAVMMAASTDAVSESADSFNAGYLTLTATVQAVFSIE
ncbi:MAG: SIMPL domain-containing protein [Pseudomonadota bacterium]